MELFLIILLIASVFFWINGIQSKERAIQSARTHCHQADVQFLDQTVQQMKISTSRDASGTWKIWRQYKFEYTRTGDDREQGRVIVLGKKTVFTDLQKIYPVIH